MLASFRYQSCQLRPYQQSFLFHLTDCPLSIFGLINNEGRVQRLCSELANYNSTENLRSTSGK